MANKLGVITDGISRDFERALQVLTEAGLNYAELQYLWEKEVGDLNDDEMAKAKALIDKYGVGISCISRHNFVGMLVGDTEVGDENFGAPGVHTRTAHVDQAWHDIDMRREARRQVRR